MISAEAAAVRATIQRELPDTSRTVADERADWEAAVADLPLQPGTHAIPVIVGGVACHIVELLDNAPESPVIVYAHGGGFTSGSSFTHRAWGSRLASATGARIVLVDYRRLPEHDFPAPVDDVAAVAEAVAIEGSRPLLLAGDSSGAALAVSAATTLRDHGHHVTGIVSLSGAFDATLGSASIDAGRDPQLDRPLLEHWQRSIAGHADLADPLVSPVFADLSGLPPVLLLAGTDEVWLDDSVRLAELLEHAELEVVDGMWHCWPMWGDFPEAAAALAATARFVRRATLGSNDGA